MRPRGILAGTGAGVLAVLLAACSVGVPESASVAPTSSASTGWVEASQLVPFSGTEKMGPLGSVAAWAETTYPDDFSYAYFAADPERLVIGFRDAAPGGVRDAFDATGLGFVIEEGVGVNHAEAQEVADAVAAELLTPDSTPAAVGLAPDRGARVIGVTAFTPDDAAADDLAARVARLDLPEGYSIVLSREYEEISAL